MRIRGLLERSDTTNSTSSEMFAMLESLYDATNQLEQLKIGGNDPTDEKLSEAISLISDGIQIAENIIDNLQNYNKLTKHQLIGKIETILSLLE